MAGTGAKDAAAKSTSKSRSKKHTTAIDKEVVSPDVDLTQTEASHVRVVDVMAQSEASAKDAQKNFKIKGNT